MAKVAKRRGYSYRVTDLDYPAVSVASPLNALGAKLGAGKAFAFGRSVETGVNNLRSYYRGVMKNCSSTKWVLGGYSQGALVMAQAVESLAPSKVVYVGLFGDPWTNLPEGKGLLPKACYGKKLSSYRVYVPYCGTHTGSLGARSPYVASGFTGEYGLWCNKNDYICGSSRRLSDNAGHTKYAQKNEFIWMASIVERILPGKTNSGVRSVEAEQDEEVDDVDDIFEAHFTTELYNIGMMGTVIVDASPSFSLGHEIVEYQWSVNGSAFWSTGAEPTISRTIDFPDVDRVTVRVINDAGEVAEATVRVVTKEGDGDDDTMIEPRHLTSACSGGEISVAWTDGRPRQARYILVRLNDVDLGYVPVTELSATIGGIDDYGEVTSLKVAWLDENLELGDWAEVALDCPAAVNIDPVETGEGWASPILLAAGAVAIYAIVVYKKYLPR